MDLIFGDYFFVNINQVEMGTWHPSGDVEVSYLDPSLERLYFGYLEELRTLEWYRKWI
jgi:hypothetical protein